MRILCCLTSGLIYFRLCFDMLAVEMLTTAMEITWKQWKERKGCSLVTTILTGGRGHFWRWQTDGNCQVDNPDSGPRLSCSLLLLRLETLNQKFDPHPAAARPPMGAGDGVTWPGGRPMGSQEAVTWAVSAVLWNYQGTRMRRKKGMKAVTQLQTFITVWIISNAEKQ